LANDGVLVGTILSVSGETAVLSVAADKSATDCPCIFGHTIDDAMAAAVQQCRDDYAIDGVTGVVKIPGGQFVASTSVGISSGVTVAGLRRDASHVYVVKITDNADDVNKSAWLRRAGGGSSIRYTSVNIEQLSLIGTFMAASSGYAADMKMIHMNTTDASYVRWCRIVDNPSTALGYDDSTDCELAFNLIIRPGRLARPSLNIQGGAGGSGIGRAGCAD
jgi:hypothetical protein